MFIVGVTRCVTLVTLREFDVPWKRYCKVYEIEKEPLVAVTYGITSIQNFSNLFLFILFVENSRLSTSFMYVSD
jgi:hypothetical protein